MIALLTPELFSHPEVDQLDLLSLLQLGWEERHVIRLEPPAESQPDAFTPWLRTLPEPLQEEIAVTCGVHPWPSRSSAWANTRELRIGPHPEPQGAALPSTLDLKMALRILKTPLYLLVENSRSDRNFLLGLLLPQQRTILQRALDRGWCVFQNGGGLGELTSWLSEHQIAPLHEDAHPTRRRTPGGVRPARLDVQLRTWVLFDHDGDEQRTPSSQSSNTQRLLTDLNLGHHQLRRRNAESYLSRQTVGDWVNHKAGPHKQRRRQTYDHLKEAHKDRTAWHHLNLKALLGDGLRDLFLDPRFLDPQRLDTPNSLLDPHIDPQERLDLASSLLGSL